MVEFYTIITQQKNSIPERVKKKFGRVKRYKIFENLKTIHGIQNFIAQ